MSSIPTDRLSGSKHPRVTDHVYFPPHQSNKQLRRISKYGANKALCETLGDFSQGGWWAAPLWQKDSAINGVKFNIENPDAPASASHDSWLDQKKAEGWTYGPVKDPEKKEHPCFVPYESLPAEQQAKDHLFKGIVAALAPLLEK